jgi:hypothetical protein
MEVLFGLISSAALGYIISKLEKVEQHLNQLENEIIIIKVKLPKRVDD